MIKDYIECLEAKVSQQSWKLLEMYRFLERDSEAYWKIQLIDELSDEEMGRIERVIYPRDQAFYNLKQGSWLLTEAYLLGEKVGHCPEPDELADDFELTRTPHRYELAHLLMWTWNVILEDSSGSSALAEFLRIAEQRSCIPYWSEYYNGLLR